MNSSHTEQRSHLGALIAALSLFTRLPFWRLRELTKGDYEDALSWWPVAGLVTATTLAGSFYLYSLLLPSSGAALALALGTRLLLTGAFHEDGLGDFFDGFGGGRERSKVLAIMKDSHVGSYAVLGLILYYLTYWSLGASLPVHWLVAVLFASDITGKVTSLLQVQLLPYARREEESKVGVTYRKARPLAIYTALIILLTAQWWALRPIQPAHIGGSELPHFLPLSLFLPLLVGGGLIAYLRKRIGGYTGDTCGALCLLCELATLTGFALLYRLSFGA